MDVEKLEITKNWVADVGNEGARNRNVCNRNERRFFFYWKCLRCRSSRTEVVLGKLVLKICIKFRWGHRFRSAISIKLLCNFIKITLWHGCSPVNLLRIFRTPFYKNTYEGLLLYISLRGFTWFRVRCIVLSCPARFPIRSRLFS